MVDNTQDVIDSRDIIEEIERLEAEIADVNDELEELSCELEDLDYEDTEEATEIKDKMVELNNQLDELKEELKPLKDLEDRASGSPDWVHGEVLICEDYFVDYTRQLVDDCYEMPKDFDSGAWPWRHMEMDWEAAADELKQDYFDVDFDGEEYWIRG